MTKCDNCDVEFRNKQIFLEHLPCELTEQQQKDLDSKRLLQEAADLLRRLIDSAKYDESEAHVDYVHLYMDEIEEFLKKVND